MKTENIFVFKYIIVGGMTTLINFIIYWFLLTIFDYNPNVSNIIAIIVSVIFAYFANKIVVFESKTTTVKSLLEEFFRFVSSRAMTMILEIVGVFIAIEVFDVNVLLAKAILTILVVIINFFLSKLLVFNS